MDTLPGPGTRPVLRPCAAHRGQRARAIEGRHDDTRDSIVHRPGGLLPARSTVDRLPRQLIRPLPGAASLGVACASRRSCGARRPGGVGGGPGGPWPRSSQGDHDVADLVTGVDMAMGLHDSFEGIAPADHRLRPSRLGQAREEAQVVHGSGRSRGRGAEGATALGEPIRPFGALPLLRGRGGPDSAGMGPRANGLPGRRHPSRFLQDPERLGHDDARSLSRGRRARRSQSGRAVSRWQGARARRRPRARGNAGRWAPGGRP